MLYIESASDNVILAVKARLRPRRRGTGAGAEVLVGGNIYGVARVISDPSGVAWAVLELIDGVRRIGEVVRACTGSEVGETDVRQVIHQLWGDGILEPVPDADHSSLSTLGSAQLLFSWMDRNPRESCWEITERLQDTHVLLVGVGGTGSHAALGLASIGVGNLTLVDDDVVEVSNLGRQVLYRPDQVGLPKTQVAVENISARFPTTACTSVQQRVACVDDLLSLTQADVDCIALGADEPQEIRAWASDASRKLGIPWVAGGYQGPQVSTWVFAPDGGACYTCLTRQQDQVREQSDELQDLTHWTKPTGHPVTYVTAAISGALLANAAASVLVGVPDAEHNCQYFSNLVRPDHSFVIRYDGSSPRCDACRSAA